MSGDPNQQRHRAAMPVGPRRQRQGPWLEQNTVELPQPNTVELPSPRQKTGAPPRSGFWRESAGVLTGGIVVLAVLVVAADIVAWARGEPGLGVVALLGHLLAAVLAVLAQRQADNRVGRPALAAGVSATLVVLTTLWLFWWL